MPKRQPLKHPEVVQRAVGNLMYDSTQLDEEVDLPIVPKPEPGKNVDESFAALDLPAVSSKDLSRYLQYTTGVLSFSLVQTAHASNRVRFLKEQLTRTTASIRVLFQDGKEKWRCQARVEENPTIKKINARLIKAEALLTLFTAHKDAYEVRTQMLSRELSRRAQEIQK